MQELNDSVFLFLNASSSPGATQVLVAKFFADDAIWSIPVALVAG